MSQVCNTRNGFETELKFSFFAKHDMFVGNMKLFCNFSVNTQTEVQLGCLNNSLRTKYNVGDLHSGLLQKV